MAPIEKGDVIVEVNPQPATSIEEVREVIAKANNDDTLLLLVKRDRGSFFIVLNKNT